MKRLDAYWQDRNGVSALLAPLAALYCGVAVTRRALYRAGLLERRRIGVPVVVVGNITVGGTGKTPLVTALANLLTRHGWRPAVVSRGYGGRASRYPQQVRADADPTVVGDEAILLAARCGCPVAVGPDRPAVAAALVAETGANVILSDDGLQHYRLARDLEIAVVDGIRWFGNGRCLPAGPLREPVSRLRKVDAVVVNGIPGKDQFGLRLVPADAQPVTGRGDALPLTTLRGRTVHGVAGIGHPPRFFDQLRKLGCTVIEHPYPDHHPFRPQDIAFGDGHPVVMTEKDAVKCRRFAGPEHWYIPVTAELDARFEPWFLERLRSLPDGQEAA